MRAIGWVVVAIMAFAGCATDELGPEPATSSTEQALSGADGNAYVRFHRDRLLTGYASSHGFANAAAAWASFTYEQRLLFLMETDLLGNRTFMAPTANYYYHNWTDDCGAANELCGTCSIMGGQRGCGSCAVRSEQWASCDYVSAYDCYLRGQCYEQAGVRTDWSMALEHVTKLYEILPGYGSCSGTDQNRGFYSADEVLINAFRNRTTPEWVANSDIGAVHAPFNKRSETNTGRPFSCDGPDGQVQFYDWDYQGVGFYRGGKYLPPDGRMFEFDNDFNTTHDSNPACSYCGGQSGVSMYESHWRYKGNAQPIDWAYAPSAAQAGPQITGEQLANSPWTANTASLNNYIAIWGNNFCSNPQVTIGGVAEYAYLAGANQINAYVYSYTPAGVQNVTVSCNGVSSNPWQVTIEQPFSCSLSGPSVLYVGQYGYWSGSSTPAGYYAYWYGTKNGVTDASGLFAGTTNFGYSVYYDPSTRGSYTRYLQIRDGANNVKCTSNTIYTTVY
jgi:hypothetical protein